MTQALSTSPLRLQLTPMQIPEASPARGMMEHPLVTSTAPAELQLLAHPGEPSEMIAQLQNLGTRPLQLQVQVEGTFPTGWCRIGGMEGQELAPGQQVDLVLYFQVPIDFFESPHALQPQQARGLDYECRLLIYYTVVGAALPSTGLALTQDRFKLQVRPRSLYLDFLPAIYREVDFVSRLLKLFEQSFEPTVHALESMWAHLDPLTAPQALLPFLAYWVACPINSRWSVERQRRLIRNAMELYRWRGTKRGLRLYLHLYTDLPLDEHVPKEADKHISITELFSDGFVLSGSHIGEGTMLGGGRRFHFIVRLRQDFPNQVDAALVRYILDHEKPAHCTYDLDIETLEENSR